MAEGDPEPRKGKCTICESFNMKGTWTCECDAVNTSRDLKCWKCGKPRIPEEQ